MTLVALLLIVRVSMPAPVRTSGKDRRPSPSAALREAPAALRAIAVMAAINFVLALVAVALLPMAVRRVVLRRGGLRSRHRSARLRSVRRPAASAHRSEP